MLGLNQVDIDYKRGQIHVQRHVYKGKEGPPKNGKPRHVPMTQRASGACASFTARSSPVPAPPPATSLDPPLQSRGLPLLAVLGLALARGGGALLRQLVAPQVAPQLTRSLPRARRANRKRSPSERPAKGDSEGMGGQRPLPKSPSRPFITSFVSESLLARIRLPARRCRSIRERHYSLGRSSIMLRCVTGSVPCRAVRSAGWRHP